MQMGLGTEALDASQHRRPGDVALSQEFDDRLIEGSAVPVIALTDIDSDQQGGSFALHPIALPTVRPAKTAPMPRAPDSVRLSRARPQLPSSARRHDSSIRVENVV